VAAAPTGRFGKDQVMDQASFLGLEIGSDRGSRLLCTQREGSDWARELARARFLHFCILRSFVGLFVFFR
jgi:hypothetical protein